MKDTPVLLPGGSGTTFKAGSLILKPVENSDEHAWIAQVINTLPQTGFRLARQLQAHNGDWVYKGWSASTFLEGHEVKGKWKEKVSVSQAFHQALAPIPCPSFIGTRMNPWALADKVAFGELPFDAHQHLLPALNKLRADLTPIDLPYQLIHGDMPGNILFQDGQAPAIIDFSFYWRPAAFATAIILVDAIVWEGAPDTVLNLVEYTPMMHQLLLRAEMRRILELDGLYKQSGNTRLLEQVHAHTHLIDVLCSRSLLL
ncbi:phosphotransferase [Tengunoibacter tsumagoiensis]|uniref:phosphotransferase n=1 Tax=Tengunoibacter tsumagoiensis TaxID=2014871 RepID=UPI0013868ADE|nr:phosphotransferase [Tengunoibacter tsumagoiensis]